MKIPIKNIIVGPRQRIELGDLSDLDSMGEPSIGLLQPIGVNEKNELIWGRRRLAKAIALGWTEIDAIVRPGLSPVDKQLAEYYEDIGRKDRTWQEKCLAVATVYSMMTLKKGGEGERWTLRNMESFTGIGKSVIGYMLQVADALKREPRDDEIWKQDGYVPAVKLLIQRVEKEVEGELERRRQKLVVAEYSKDPTEEDAPGSVQDADKTEDKAEVIHIHGHKLDFADAVIAPDSVAASLGLCPSDAALRKLVLAMRANSYGVIWGKEFNLTPTRALIWNMVNLPENEESTFPVSNNYLVGRMFCRKPQACLTRQGAVVTTPNDERDTLPPGVVEFSLRSIAGGAMSVLLIGGVHPRDVAELGLVPIFYEKDPEKFKLYCEELEDHYRKMFPTIEFRYP